MIMGQSKLIAYLAPNAENRDFTQDLRAELNLRKIKILSEHGRLFLCEGNFPDVVFAQEVWFDVEILTYNSINDASEKLRDLGDRYYHYSSNCHRRGELILSKLKSAKHKTFQFLAEIPLSTLSVFSLISDSELIFSPRTNSPLPMGEIHFLENKILPPSRAYLKLWELFTLYKIRPNENDRVIDMGSCPGGWTWVLQTLNCNVISVDKAPLDPKIAGLPNIEFRQESAFGLRPMHVGELDWFFSDIICYPSKLYELVGRYRDYGKVRNFACTIKFQNSTDFETMFKFLEIPNSKIIHLFHNKHEVTWINTQNV